MAADASALIEELRARIRDDPDDEGASAELAALLFESADRVIAAGPADPVPVLLELAAELSDLADRFPRSWSFPLLACYLGTVHEELWLQLEDARHLETAVRHARAGQAADPADTGLRLLLGDLLDQRYAMLAERADRLGAASGDGGSSGGDARTAAIAAARADRDEAIEVLGPLLGPETSPEGTEQLDGDVWLEAAAAAGRLRYARYDDSWPGAGPPDRADLDAACELLRAVVERNPAEREAYFLVLALHDRLDLRPDPGDRDAFLTWAGWLLDQCGETEPDGPLSGGLGEILREEIALKLLERASDGGGPDGPRPDLDAAIAHLEVLAGAAPPGSDDRRDLTALLAMACWERLGGDSGDYEQVDRLVRYARQAWDLLEEGTEDWQLAGLYLSVGLYEQLRRPTVGYDAESTDLVIRVLTAIEPRLAGDQEGMRPQVLAMLGVCHVARAQETGNAADLAAAGSPLLAAARALPDDHPAWADLTQTVAGAVFILATLDFSAQHFDLAIRLLSAACAHPVADPELAAFGQAALGEALILRVFHQGRRDISEGIGYLKAAYETAPAGSGIRLMVAGNLGSALMTRFMQSGNRQELQAALYYLEPVFGESAAPESHLDTLIANRDVMASANLAIIEVLRGLDGDSAAMERSIAHFRTAIRLLPEEHPYRTKLRGDLGLTLMLRAGKRGGDLNGLRQAAAELDAAAAALPAGNVMHVHARLRAGSAIGLVGVRARDPRTLREGIGYLTRLRGDLPPEFADLPRVTGQLGLLRAELYALTGRSPDFADAEEALVQAAAESGLQPGHAQHAAILVRLARLRRSAGRDRTAVEAGMAALQVRVRDVLLQTGPAHGLTVARAAASEAAEVAGWCLEDADPATAVQALELGRGLVLHAATSAVGLPELLDAAGQDDLARQWRERAETGETDRPWDQDPAGDPAGLLSGQPLEVPGDLRERTLEVLTGPGVTDSGDLLTPPGPEVIGGALAAVGADALVYLLPSDGSRPGHALIVPAGAGTARASTAGSDAAPLDITLPLLRPETSGPLDDYAAAYEHLVSLRRPVGADRESRKFRDWERARETALTRWRETLRAACDWAWPAVTGSLLRELAPLASGGVPRIVLVPAGRLSLVPWHAARRAIGPGGFRYACADAVFSYAASGRQLVQAGQRQLLPLDSAPVIVAPRTSRPLAFAIAEAEAIRSRYYRGARYLGQAEWSGTADGYGTPGEVLRVMPSADRTGPSLLHFACHADVNAAAPEESHLLLARDQPLLVKAILRQVRGRRPGAPGGVVDLAACRTDLAAADYDEALTLATAFLAAGAATVIGTRWEVPDGRSAVLMFMYHRFLAQERESPRDALRRAQLWMLDSRREIPLEMPVTLREHVSDRLADITAWAGVTHQGR